MSELDMLLRLFFAAVLGGLIGIERERQGRPAGLRTHILVAVGSALLMLVSIEIANGYSKGTADPGRIAAQVVSGIGFLGAGTILREGANVRGLTTAASLWVAAALGLASGAGMYLAALITTVIVLMALILLSRVEKGFLDTKQHKRVRLTVVDRPGQLGKITTLLGKYKINIVNLEMESSQHHEVDIQLILRVPADTDLWEVLDELMHVDGVLAVDHEF